MLTKVPKINISIKQSADRIYRAIVEGECKPYLSLQSRCNMHSGPCRYCASAQVCHTEKPTLGISAKEMFDALKLSIICPNDLYRI